jgi:phage terminase Nu1 subunit (DNA packaging protein)
MERAALRRVEATREEDLRWQYYETIPQKHWQEMSGRSPRILKDQEAKYGIPFGGRVVNLSKVAKAIHDFFAKHYKKFLDPETDLEMLTGGTSPALERFRLARAKREERKLAEERMELVSIHKVHDGLARITTALRNAGDAVQRQFGPEAHEIIVAAIKEAEEEGLRYFGEPDKESQNKTDEALGT